MRALSLILGFAVLLAAAALPGRAEEAVHPLMVLKATYNNESGGARAVDGTASVWLKNVSDVTVDGVSVTLKLAEGGRVVRTMEKKVGEMEAGKKAYLDYDWEEYTGKKLKPQIWITYNGSEGPVTFRTEPPVW